MTKEWAIRTLRGLHLLAENQEEKEAILMAIKALKQQLQDQDRNYGIINPIYLNNIRLIEYCCPKCGTKMEEVVADDNINA